MTNESINARGHLTIVLIGPDGRIKDQRELDNLIVTSGKNWLASRMTGAPAAMSHMAIGTTNTAPVVADAALKAEVARVALAAQATTNNVTTYDATFPAGTGTGAIVEAGIFNAGAAGTMLNRATFAVVNKGADDVMSITWTVTQN